jgi:hypothetical protein
MLLEQFDRFINVSFINDRLGFFHFVKITCVTRDAT